MCVKFDFFFILENCICVFKLLFSRSDEFFRKHLEKALLKKELIIRDK